MNELVRETEREAHVRVSARVNVNDPFARRSTCGKSARECFRKAVRVVIIGSEGARESEPDTAS